MKKLILSDTHKKIGGKMIDFAGFYMPVQYSGIIEEHNTVRNNVGVFDVSHMGQIFISGNNSKEFLQFITSNDVNLLKPGHIQYTCLPNYSGGIVDDLLLYMLSDNHYLLVVNASNIKKDFDWINNNNNGCIVSNKSEDYSLLAVQGPKTIDVLQQIADVNLSEINYYNFKVGSIGKINNVIISRTGYTGELGFELYVENKNVEYLWNKIFSISKIIKPIGLAARDTLRLEKGFCLYGNDIDDTTSPIEAGLGWITKFNNNFVNCKNLKLQKDGEINRKLVAIELIDQGIARNGYSIFDIKGNRIGNVTSGTKSPTLNIAIALGYVTTKYADMGTNIFIKIRNKFIKAKIVSLPFVK